MKWLLENGMFAFETAGIETVMRQLSRWYDVEIEYKGKLMICLLLKCVVT
jgi:hypothetical protein